MKNKFAVLGTVSALLIGGVAVKSATSIAPGYTGIVYSMDGGVQDTTLSQGFHFVNPLHKVISYSTSSEQGYLSSDAKEGSEDNDSFYIPTSDGKSIQIDLEYSYRFDVDRLPETFTRFKGQDGKTIEQVHMRGKIKTWVGEAASKFSVMDIHGEKRQEVNAAVLEYVRDKFDDWGVVIESINITDIKLDEATKKVIDAKIQKEQEVEAAKAEAERAAVENQQNIDKAKAKAEEKAIAAEGDAQAILTKAEAEATANKKLAESLTEEIIQIEYIKTWDGKLPQVSSSDANVFMGLDSADKK